MAILYSIVSVVLSVGADNTSCYCNTQGQLATDTAGIYCATCDTEIEYRLSAMHWIHLSTRSMVGHSPFRMVLWYTELH